MTNPCRVATSGAAQGLADHDGAAADRGDQHLAEEPELAVPDDRGRREHGGEQHADAEHTGEDEGSQIDPAAPRHQRRQAGTHHQQPKDGLEERRHHPGLVAPEQQQFPMQHDLHGPQVVDQAPPGHPHLRDLGNDSDGHAIPSASAAQHVLPVAGLGVADGRSGVFRKTSSRDGLATCTDVIGTPSSANIRGTNSSPEATAKVTFPRDGGVKGEVAFQRRDRRLASPVSIWTRSLPTLALTTPGCRGRRSRRGR